MNNLLQQLDSILFCLLFAEVVYLFIFALYSLRKTNTSYPAARKQHRFLILFPAYREDSVIEEALHCFLKQAYPSRLYELAVISDQMRQDTNDRLRSLPITLLQPDKPLGSKAAALNFAMDNLKGEYDCVVVMDADNIVGPDFLQKINEVFDFGVFAIQAHRKAKNKNTDVAVLDAISEEINNAIFRKGHINAGLSSALSGSGMAFEYHWFIQNIQQISSTGEDKELELLLLQQNVYIEYLDNVIVYDEKISTSSSFYNQRRRWIAAQFHILNKGIRYLPAALFTGNMNYCNKIFQWLLLPRVVLLGISFIIASLLSYLDWTLSFKWWGILVLLILTLSIAMPDELYDKSFRRAIKRVPVLFIYMIFNFFRTKGADKKFIHTKHGGNDI